MHLVFMTLEYFRIAALQKWERNPNAKKRESASFSLLCPPSFLSPSFQRPRQTRAETLATQATPEKKFIHTLSSVDRLSAAFLYRDW